MILSWTDELMRAYDILNSTNDRNLLPLCHSTQNAQITIDINSDGTIPSIGFAEKVEKEDAVTIIPVTEDSSSRGAGINPHPLADKLIYILQAIILSMQTSKKATTAIIIMRISKI